MKLLSDCAGKNMHKRSYRLYANFMQSLHPATETNEETDDLEEGVGTSTCKMARGKTNKFDVGSRVLKAGLEPRPGPGFAKCRFSNQ